jgi:hypothetical protein
MPDIPNASNPRDETGFWSGHKYSIRTLNPIEQNYDRQTPYVQFL